MKLISLSLCAFFLVNAAHAGANDPQVLMNERPEGLELIITLDYKSRFKKSDIDAIINPANDRIQELFADPMLLKGGPSLFQATTSVSALVKKITVNCDLKYSQSLGANKSTHAFSFSNFTRVFKKSNIKIDVVEGSQDTKVSIVQVALMKPEAYHDLRNIPFGMSTLKSKIAANIKKFRKNTGGII